jgi:hypothetical protein
MVLNEASILLEHVGKSAAIRSVQAGIIQVTILEIVHRMEAGAAQRGLAPV